MNHDEPNNNPGSPGESIWKALYFASATVTTVGFGDYAPKTDKMKIVTIFYILVGLVLVFKVIVNVVFGGILRAYQKRMTAIKHRMQLQFLEQTGSLADFTESLIHLSPGSKHKGKHLTGLSPDGHTKGSKSKDNQDESTKIFFWFLCSVFLDSSRENNQIGVLCKIDLNNTSPGNGVANTGDISGNSLIDHAAAAKAKKTPMTKFRQLAKNCFIPESVRGFLREVFIGNSILDEKVSKLYYRKIGVSLGLILLPVMLGIDNDHSKYDRFLVIFDSLDTSPQFDTLSMHKQNCPKQQTKVLSSSDI